MTFPTKFSERMRAAMFPQQNLKRREAAFLLGATAFRTREMQKCASPFVEVRQIEFLARETPNCTLPRTCTHIPSMDMRERERFASQGAKRRGRNPQRCYDPSDDRDGTAGVPSTQPVLVREPTSAFSSLGRLVLSSMLDAKEQGRSAPRKAPSYLSPNQGIDPLIVEGRTYRRAKPIFYKCVLRGYSFTILCFAKSFGKVVRQARHLCAQSAALMCLMGTPHTPLYARRTVRITGTSGGFPSPRKAAPTQRIMMPSSP